MGSFNGLIERARETYHGGGSGGAPSSESSNAGSYSGLIERAQKNYSGSGFNQIDRLAFDANNFLRAVDNDNSGEKRFNAADFFEERKKQANALKTRAASIARQIESSVDSYSQKSYDSMMNYLSNFNTMIDDVMGYYQPALDSRAGMRAYEDEMIAAQERNDLLKGLNRQVMFGADSTSPGYGMLERFYQYDTDNSYRGINSNWTDEERYTLGQLQREDPAKARDYATQVNNYYNAQSTEATRENIRQNAVANKGKSTAAALLASTFTAPGEFMDRLAENMARGTTTEKRYVSPTEYAQEITGAISEDLNQRYGTIDGEQYRQFRNQMANDLRAAGVDGNYDAGLAAANFASGVVDDKGVGDIYNLGYNVAQNALSRYALGSEFGVLGNYFMSAATSGIDEARKVGATGNQAVASGVLKGAWEVLTEKAPLDKLFKMGPAVTWGDLFKTLGKQGMSEALGEGVNSALGYISDQLVLGDLSEYSRMVQEYVAQGETEENAKWLAFRDAAQNVGFEALSGALSGWASGGIETVGKTAQANLSYRNVDAQSLINEGMETNTDSKSYALAQQMQQNLDANNNISGNQKRVLGQNIQLQQLAEEKAAAEAAATEDLMELGQVENLEQLADLVARRSMGEDLSWKDKRTIRKNQNVQTLLSTMEDSSSGSSSSASVPEASTFRRTTENTQVSKDGRAIQISTENPVDVLDFASVDNGVATVQLTDGETAAYDDIAFANQQQANQFYAVSSLPSLDTETANDLLHTIQEADAGKTTGSVVGIREAYRLGYMGAQRSELRKTSAAVLDSKLRNAIYDIAYNKRVTDGKVRATAQQVTAKPSEGYKKVVLEGKTSKLDEKRTAELNFVDKISDSFSGTTVHVYESFRGKDGKYYYTDNNGEQHIAPNGRYVNGEIWLDLNAGNKGEGLVLNTFAHEMYHHIEKYNKPKANELAEFLVKELGLKTVDKAVVKQIQKARAAGYGEQYFMDKGMSKEQAANTVYARAMSDFVADSLETVFTSGNPAEAIARLKTENRSLFDEIKAFVDQRVLREQLTGKESDITIMEREFIRIVKEYEKIADTPNDLAIMEEEFGRFSKAYDSKTRKDAKKINNLKKKLKAEAEKHKEDSKTWERKFNRLLRDYETSGRQIERLEATIIRQRETAKQRVAGRRNTEMRHKIQKKVNDLNRLLLHGTKNRNVPEGLQAAVAAVLDAINMETKDIIQRVDAYEATLKRYSERIAKATNPAEVERLIEQRNKYAAKGDQFGNKMAELKAAYEKIQKDKIPEMEMDAGIYEHLMTLFVIVGDTPLGQMTTEQLNAVNDVLNITTATIRNVNKMLAEERAAGIVENSKEAIQEIRRAGGEAKKKTDIQKAIEKFAWDNLKPVYVFETIGSEKLQRLFHSLRKGEDTLAVDLSEAKSFFQEQWKKHNGDSWDMEEKWKFTSTSGKKFELDLNQIMSLYALAKRDQARSHLRVGGFTFDSDYKTNKEVKLGPVKFNVGMENTDASAYNLSDEILGEIISTLTAEQRKFVDAMQGYLSNDMAAKGNQISLKKYGIRLFKEANYFPLRVADQFMARVRERQTGDRKLANAGFTKEVTPEAKNPVVLSGFTEVWAEHVDEMSLYHSFVLPLDDLNRVLNYHDQFKEGEDAASVVEAIRNAYGKGAADYIDKLIRDVNGGERGDSAANFMNKMMGKAKKAQTMASLSVAIQQPSSIIRAMSMIDGKYFIGAKPTEKSQNRTWEEIKKYAPVARIKEMGGFDTNVGQSTVDYLTDTTNYDGFSEKFSAFFKDGDFRDDVFGKLPELMDELAWGAIWNAVKREQKAMHPNMDVKSDAFMSMVADRFTDVITRTQVYDSVFSRSGMMRSKDGLVKMATSFMAEPTTTANMMAIALINAKRGGKAERVQAARTVASLAASLALNAALVSIVYALRDDDEDKRYSEKWLENFRNNFFESLNPAIYIPFIRDIDSMRKGFDIERTDMTLIGDLMNAIQGLGDDEVSAMEKTMTVIGAVGDLLGIPMKNIIRDVKGLVQTAGFALDDRKNPATSTGKYMATHAEAQNLTDGQQLLLAIQRGDEEHFERVASRFENQQKAESALQSAIAEQYKAGELTAEEAQELLNTYFDRDNEHEVYWILDKWDYAVENGTSEGYTKMGALFEAIEAGGDIEAAMQRYLDHGSEMSDIRSQITSKYRKQYLEADEAARAEIRDKITSAYLATGMDEDEVLAKFNDWDFESTYGMTYSEMKEEFRNGNVTESEMRNAMKVNGLLNFEIEEDIRSLKEEMAFKKKFGMSMSELKDAYDDGEISRNLLISALEYNGMTKNQAREEVSKRDISNRLGIDYMKLDDAYKAGDISRQTLYNAMIENGTSRQEADDAIVAYDWLKKNYKKYPDLTVSDAKKFVIKISTNQEDYTLSDYGVTIDHYQQYAKLKPDCKGVDANGDGVTDSGTLRDSIFRMIDSLPISKQEKDGLALISYGIKSIRKNAPWHKK